MPGSISNVMSGPVRLSFVALLLLFCSACTYHSETPLDLAPRSGGDAKPTAQRSGRLLPVRAVRVKAPLAGDKLFGIGVMEQGSVSGFSYGPFLRATNTYVSGTDIAPLITQAMSRVVKIDPNSGIEVEADATFGFDAFTTGPAWYEWYQHRHAKVLFKLQLVFQTPKGQVLEKEITTSSSKEFTWSLAHTPSDEFVQGLIRAAIEQAAEEMSADKEIRRLSPSI